MARIKKRLKLGVMKPCVYSLLWWWSFLLVSFGSVVSAFSGELNKQLVEKYNKEAPDAWTKINMGVNNFLQNNQGWTMDTQQQVLEDNKTKQQDEFTEKRIGLTHRLFIHRDLLAKKEILRCGNPTYAFDLQRASNNQWVVTGVYPPSPKGSGEGSEYSEYQEILEAPREVRHDELPNPSSKGTTTNWVGDKVDILDIVEVVVENHKCIKMEVKFPRKFFERTGEGNKLKETQVEMVGTAVFDMENHWTLLSFSWGRSDKENSDPKRSALQSQHDFKYEQLVDGVPIRTFTRHAVKNLETNSYKSESKYQVTHSFEPLHPKEFTLSAFGFPEPEFIKPPYWKYASMGGLVLVVVGGAIYYWGVRLRN